MRSFIHRLHRDDAGMTTAEYAVGTVAAVAFAVTLYKIVTSSAVLEALSNLVTSALQVHL
jgi:Flp pilus assembly pilin Flp